MMADLMIQRDAGRCPEQCLGIAPTRLKKLLERSFLRIFKNFANKKYIYCRHFIMPLHDICSVILIPQLPLCFFLSEKEDVFPLKRLHRAEVGGAFLETDGNRGHDFPDDI